MNELEILSHDGIHRGGKLVYSSTYDEFYEFLEWREQHEHKMRSWFRLLTEAREKQNGDGEEP